MFLVSGDGPRFLTSPKFTARTTKAPHEWATKAVPTKAQAETMPLVLKRGGRYFKRVAKRSHDSMLGERSAIEDGFSPPYLETDCDRPPTHVASDKASACVRS